MRIIRFLSVFALGVLLLTGSAALGQQKDSEASDAYEFPVKPGTPEWATLQSHAEMLRVCQIPEPTPLTNGRWRSDSWDVLE